jgi:hypothetical protein
LVRVKLLKTCGLWTFRDLLLALLLLQNEPTDVGPIRDDNGEY